MVTKLTPGGSAAMSGNVRVGDVIIQARVSPAPCSASLVLTDYSQVAMLGLRCTCERERTRVHQISEPQKTEPELGRGGS